ncbi:MAG TPA: chromosomal replication initiator protein DnaA [Bryobacteraceae bacterium]|nr:chromosomal replication initiator protein DnaA [Bryobacteraceae bacterium]
MNTWDRIKNQLASKISGEAFRNWLSGTAFLASEEGKLRVSVPDASTRDWIQREYSAEIWSAVRDLDLPVREILFEIHGLVPGGAFRNGDDKSEIVFAPCISLNPRFTFDSFVVGSCNQFAHAAARAVVTNPSRSYNPLFIYGGVGMGKTHLMHAIGRSLADQYAAMRIVYTSSERFMNEMITCIKNDRMQLFQRHYRSADALLVDDIQILAGKERTMEEFFHTFNELFEHQKQIVISSDTPPKNTPGLVERLRSRFEWGLMVDVQPPDLETKMAILDKKAEAEGIRLPEEVRIFIATKTKSNVRELEGALVKLTAYSEVTGTPITLAMAQQVLKHLTAGQERRITIESIIKAVAEKFSLQPSQLKQKTNEQKIAYPRQIAMYLAKDLTSASLPEIGRAFSGKHHTTVLHSIQKIDKLRQRDQDLNSLIHNLIDTIH